MLPPFLLSIALIIASCFIFVKNEKIQLNVQENTKLPIMLIHGEKDTFVPCEMSKKAFENCHENCRLFLSSEAGHGTSFLFDTEDLISQIKSFLTDCLDDS